MRLEKIIEALKMNAPGTALGLAEDALKFAKEQCGSSVPSSGHGYLEELAGLYRVTKMKWDDAEQRARPARGNKLHDCRNQCEAEHWQSCPVDPAGCTYKKL